MKKISGIFKGVLKNRRGNILAITSLIVAMAGGVALVALSSLLYKVTNVNHYDAAYNAALSCVSNFDNMAKNIIDLTCSGDGQGIDFANSNDTRISCVPVGEANSIQTVGVCTCATQIVTNNTTSFVTVSTGICPSDATNRAGDDKYKVSITKTIDNCLGQVEICPTPGSVGTGGVCGSCGNNYDDCCLTCDTAPCCQAGICVE